MRHAFVDWCFQEEKAIPLRYKLDLIEFLVGLVIFLIVWAVRYWKMGSGDDKK
jgi:hypothetical protein